MIIGLFTDTYEPDINGVATATKMLKETLEANGHQVYVVTTGLKGQKEISFEKRILRIPGRALSSLYNYRMASFFSFKAYKMLKKIPFDIIHVQQEFGISSFGRIVSKLLDVPLVYTFHTSYQDYTQYVSKGIPFLDTLTKHTVKAIVRRIVSKQSEIITPSNKAKSILKAYGADSYINVIPNAIDLSGFEKPNDPDKELAFREEYGLLRKKIVLYLGRMGSEKHVSELIDDYNKYLDIYKRNDTMFLLVGDGPELEKLKEQVNVSHHPRNFLFLGKVKPEETSFYYHLADVFLNASTSETQGLTYSEALASKTIVLAKYDINLAGYIKDGITGFLFDNTDSFLSKLESILNMSDFEKAEIKEAGYAVNASLFSKEGFYKRIIHVYDKAIRTNF